MDDDQQFCLRWNNHQSTLVAVFDTLLENGTLVDCTLAAEGKYLNAHKVVLSACSPYFESLLSQNYDKHPIFILKDVKFQELKAMMDYMYRGEVNISQDQLGALLKAAESLQIKGLSDNKKDSEPRKAAPPPVAKSPPPTTSLPRVQGLTIEQRRANRSIDDRDGSQSPGPRKRKRMRPRSTDDLDNHDASNSSESHSNPSIQNIPIALPPPASSKMLTEVPEPVETKSEILRHKEPEIAQVPIIKEKIETHTELMLEPKAEYVEEMNEDSIEDLTLDDDDVSNLDMSNDGAGPSHGNMGDGSGQGFAGWHMGNQNQDEVFLAAQEAVGAHRDNQVLIRDYSPLDGDKESIIEDEYSDNTEKPSAFDCYASTSGGSLILNLPLAEEYNHVHHILKQCLDGRAIISYGEKHNGLLDASCRRKIAHLIIANELESDPQRLITRGEFTRWANEIATLFKQESPLIYYSAYVAASNFQTKRNASGKLYEAYIGRRRKLRKVGQIPPTIRTSNASPPLICHPEESDTTVAEKLQWLQKWTGPWNLVQKNWKDTKTQRLLAGQETALLSEYFQTYPALKTPRGYTLLIEDFGSLYPGIENNFFSNLVHHRGRILEVARLKAAAAKDLKILLTPYLSFVKSSTQASDVQSNAALLCLPFLLHQGFLKNTKIRWRPSRTEVRDGFITQIPTEAHLEITIQERKKKLDNLGLTLQPYVIFAGESIACITSAFVVVDNTHYKFDNLLVAVDAAFKVFHATNANYPKESESVWLIIQRVLYGITTKYDRISSSARCLLLDLGIEQLS